MTTQTYHKQINLSLPCWFELNLTNKSD